MSLATDGSHDIQGPGPGACPSSLSEISEETQTQQHTRCHPPDLQFEPHWGIPDTLGWGGGWAWATLKEGLPSPHPGATWMPSPLGSQLNKELSWAKMYRAWRSGLKLGGPWEARGRAASPLCGLLVQIYPISHLHTDLKQETRKPS